MEYLLLAAGIIIGLIIGYFIGKKSSSTINNYYPHLENVGDPKLHQQQPKKRKGFASKQDVDLTHYKKSYPLN